MRSIQSIAGVVVLFGMCAYTQAQFDSSVWPGYRGTGTKRASVTANGPAVNLAFELSDFANMSPGGFTVASNGDIYFKSYKVAGSAVYRLNPVDGSVLAQSVDLGGGPGNYGGVAVGVDAVYTCVYGGGTTTAIVKLDKNSLAVLATWTNPLFGGLRGTPLISDKVNTAGNHNLFISDRNNKEIYAIDSVTGVIQWSYDPIYDVVFGQMGPMWVLPDGRQAFAYFGNGDLGPGAALADNGDGTFEVLWDAVGPENFNWFGSGTLSSDGKRIYVTTFNDGDTSSLWAISTADGSIVWDVPGLRGTPQELNFFSRPASVGNEVYAVGAFGVVVSITDNGTFYTKNWEFREGAAEFTAGTVVETPAGDRYIYAVAQDPARLVVLKDDGASFTKMLDTDLGGSMRWTFFGSNSAAIDADGSVWVSGGRFDDPIAGDIYKFSVGSACPCACAFDTTTGVGVCDIFDFLAFQNSFVTGEPCACDIDTSTGPAICDIFDFLAFQNQFVGGCP
jgi:PQQ-like domain